MAEIRTLNFTECSLGLKKLVNTEQEELLNSYLFSEKFRNGHSKELLSEYSDSYEEKERNFLLLSGELFSFIAVRCDSFSYAP